MLIEALVALVVVGVGTFGVVKLNSVMLSGTGLSKTRAEALEIALQRMEDLRNYALDVGCPSAGGSTEADPVTGVNASYVVGRSITNKTAEMMDVDVCVAWEDGATAPCTAAADKRIILKSTVSCLGVGASGMLAGNATSQTGGKLKTPTGAAKVGGGDYGTNKPTGRTINHLGGDPNGQTDGTSTYLNAATGAYELIDEASGRVLLTVDDGSAFSTISGRVYIEADNSGNAIVSPGGSDSSTISDDNVFVLSSDASYCARIIPSTLPTISSGGNVKYRYFDYQCYVSKGWWGNIGIARLDNPNVNNRVCVGDPGVSQTETSIWSRKTALSVSRGYRAYRELGTGTGVYETTGIGVSTSDGVTYNAIKIPSAANADTEHHDFLINVITGNGSCQDSGKMNLTSPSVFTGDQGKFYCMSGQCPGLTQTESTPHTLIHGTITKHTGATVTGLSDSDCSSSTFTDNGTSYSYSCQLNWTGFAGANWQGAISFQTSGTNTLCATGDPAVVVPSSFNVAYTVNNRFALGSPNSLTFTDVPVGATDITIDFNAKAAFCGALGQPFPSWSGGDLTWLAIPGGSPTQYKIRTCTNTDVLTNPCSLPTTGGTTQSGLSYGPNFTNGVNTVCIGIIATDGSGALADSPISSTKCVSKSGNTYTHF